MKKIFIRQDLLLLDYTKKRKKKDFGHIYMKKYLENKSKKKK
jgi:hypothetical protein